MLAVYGDKDCVTTPAVHDGGPAFKFGGLLSRDQQRGCHGRGNARIVAVRLIPVTVGRALPPAAHPTEWRVTRLREFLSPGGRRFGGFLFTSITVSRAGRRDSRGQKKGRE